MAAKRVIQTYKAAHQWIGTPPGIGDFVRGACHLYELLQPLGIELRLDVSRTGFARLIEQDESAFQAGDDHRIAAAAEYFEESDHKTLRRRLRAFAKSPEPDLYLCTNLGAWDRLTLPEATREFIAKFYGFTADVERHTVAALQARDYEVLSVRCGDHFYRDPAARLPDTDALRIRSLIEQHVLPRRQLPLLVTSDCHELKIDLARRYGMLTLSHRSGHGAYGDERPVAMDLCTLKHSRFNYHINTWADWWSGFSHYTSMVFRIPSMNFRSPRFATEEITSEGRLLARRRWWHRLRPALPESLD
jgi:hypothetical protein